MPTSRPDPSPEDRRRRATAGEGRAKKQAEKTSDLEIEFAAVKPAEADEVETDAYELTEGDFVEEGDLEAELIEDSDIDDVEDVEAKPSKPEPPQLPPRQLVLIGAGHTHLQILKWWQWHSFYRTELTIVTAFDQAAYSGMLPSTLAGLYQPDDMLIDMPKLCQQCGVRLIVDRANRLDPENRVIEFAHQPALSFDVASINIGSVPAAEPLWQSHRILISVKPLSTFLQRFDVRFRELVEQWKMAPGPEMLQIVVVGAGAAGVELALCLEQHKHELELPADVRIVDGNPVVLQDYSPKTIRRIEKLLKLRGIDLSLGSPVVDCDDEGVGTLVLESGERIRADLVIWAAGASPPMALRGFDLPKTDRGFLATRPTLQTTADVPIFVTGDAADIESHPIPKAGVYAVRQAPVLWRNLQNCLEDRPLVRFKPQSDFLRILSCGDGTAVLEFKGFTSHSSWAWALKKWIDLGWVRKFQVR
ncbi:MAG: FAD-dependent oxidoreductase [Planctomycetes bacterium]|nr:FAD-dependent oxidoreductase [Planctomycetota bacterium]